MQHEFFNSMWQSILCRVRSRYEPQIDLCPFRVSAKGESWYHRIGCRTAGVWTLSSDEAGQELRQIRL